MPPEKDRKLSALDRAVMAAIGDGRTVGLESDPARKRFPSLWEWLTKTDGGGEYVMQPATINITLGPEGCLASVTHRDLRVSCGAACPNLEDVFAALESALSGPNPPVRSWGKDEPRLKKKRPKS